MGGRMIRKALFWLHLSVGVTAGVFIFVMAATGVALSFERQIVDFVDRDIRSVPVSQDPQPRPLNDLLQVVRRAGLGEPTAILIRKQPQASIQFSIGRNKAVYVDPYSGAVLGASSVRTHQFFSAVERLHRALGAPLGPRNIGHWLAAISNFLFGVLILLGMFLWLPRKWSWTSLRASIAFRSGLRGRAREWNWHNVVGIWCAIPLLVIVLTGVVMSFDWANALLFRLSESSLALSSRGGEKDLHAHELASTDEPDYDQLLAVTKTLNRDWRTITLNVPRDANTTIS